MKIVLLGMAAALAALADTYPRQSGIDVLHYTFRLSLTDESDEILGDTSVEIRFLKDGVKEFALDLASAADGKGMTVSDVSSGTPLQFSHRADRLTIQLASSPKAGERHEYHVRYRGIPASGLRIGKNKYDERCFFSENWPDHARQWLPMVDHPYDKATSEFIITAPSKYQVVANGLLQEETDLGDGRRLTHWKQSVPIASWLNAVGVAQFASRHFGTTKGIELQTWVYHQDRENGMITFEEPARKSIEFYSENIGPFSYEKLANVEAAGLRGGTEHASAIFYGETSVTNRPATSLVAHEIAHQWFGDSVTEKDWDDVWLSEGFATYFALLYTEHFAGRDAFVSGLNRSRENIFRLEKASPEIAVTHNNLSDIKKILNRIIYEKGGWTLHMLRGFIGTDNFWSGIRTYYQRYQNISASTADFRHVMEETSGQDLEWFFKQWLYRPGSPSVEWKWMYNAVSQKLVVALTQTHSGDAYRLPLEVGFTVEGTPEMKLAKLDMTAKQQTFEIDAAKQPTSVILDPNTWVLMQAKN